MAEREAKKVLLVDPIEEEGHQISQHLSSRGYNITCVYSGEQGLASMEKYSPDIFIVDCELPDMNCFDFLRKIKKSESWRRPFVFISTYSSDLRILNVYQEGADYFLPRPFKFEAISNVVDYLIGDLAQEDKERLGQLI